jgi:putative peptidoglycan lipid II flippase
MLSALRAIALLGVPAALAVLVLREPVIRVLLERGQFSAADTVSTANVLLFYSGYAVGGMIGNVTSRVLWAFRDWRFMLILAVVNLAIYVTCIGWFARLLGKEGVALTTSLVFNVSWIIQLAYIRWRVGSYSLLSRARSLGRYVICVGSFVAGSLAALKLADLVLPEAGRLADVATIGSVALVGYLSLFGAAWLCRVEPLVGPLRRILRDTRHAWATISGSD